MIISVTADNEKHWATLCTELWPENTIEAMLKERETIPLAHEFLYYKDNQPVAFISLSLRQDYVEGTDGNPVAYLEGIYVKAEFRRMGIAQELFEFAKIWGKEKGCAQLASDCELGNVESFNFHTSIGFTEANRLICFTLNL